MRLLNTLCVYLRDFNVSGAMALLKLRSSSSLGNIFLLASMAIGNTGMVVLYSIEYYARVNCGKTRVSGYLFFYGLNKNRITSEEEMIFKLNRFIS